jgi:hypothetical protein
MSMSFPDLLCASVYALAVLIGVLQIAKLIKYRIEKMRRQP